MNTSTIPVQAYLAAIKPAARRADAVALLAVMGAATGLAPRMWATSFVGFGELHYENAWRQNEEIMVVGFAARAEALVLYGLMSYAPNLERLAHIGPHTTAKGKVYIKDMSTIDREVLGKVVATAYKVRSSLAG